MSILALPRRRARRQGKWQPRNVFGHYRLPRPASFLGLLILGFAAVVLPLAVALVVAVVRSDDLAGRGSVTTREAVILTRGLQQLSSQLVEMERAARQYAVLKDMELLDRLMQHHAGFQSRLAELRRLGLSAPMRIDFDAQAQETAQAVAIALKKAQSGQIDDAAIERLAGSGASLVEMRSIASRHIDAASDRIEAEAAALRRVVTVQVVGSLVLAALLIIWFSSRLSRPVKQLTAAIHRMGTGDLKGSARIDGPADLIAVGERLDWLRQQLAAANHQKATFLAHVSHELKTPLASLREGTAILSDGVTGTLSAEQRRVVEILERGIERLEQKIGELLEAQRVARDRLALRLDNVQLDALLRDCLEEQALVLRARELKVDCTAPALRYTGDGEKLQTLCANLLDNAVKYAPRGSTITVRLDVQAGSAQLDVMDRGPGIPRLDREQVFEPFYKSAQQPDGAIKGTGLGLAIARTYARAHGGEIQVIDSRQGAHLRVTLPLQRDAGAT